MFVTQMNWRSPTKTYRN